MKPESDRIVLSRLFERGASRRSQIFVTVTLFMLMLGACGGDQPTDPGTAAVASVVVAPARDTLVSLGEAVQLTAMARDGQGTTLSGKTFQWSTSAPGVATVTAAGEVTAVANGAATVTATAEGKSGAAQITVSQEAVAVQVSPTLDTLNVLDEMLQLTAAAVDARGNAIGNADIAWASSDEGVATVDAAGLVSAINNGSATITATTGVIEGQAVIAVVTNQARLGPDGGTVSAADGQVEITFPAGAVSQSTIVTVEPTNMVPASVRFALATGFLFSPEGVQFAQPVQLTIRYGPANILPGLPEATLRLGKVVGGSFVDLPGSTVNIAARSVTAPIDGLSVFAVLTEEPGPQVSVAVGDIQSCAIVTDGGTWCWGQNSDGVFGNGTVDPGYTPTPVAAAVGLNLRQLEVAEKGGDFACGVEPDGTAYCWGNNSEGTLGVGFVSSFEATPQLVSGGLIFRMVDAGETHACGVTAAGDAYCWGSNSSNQLGDGSGIPRVMPTLVAGALSFRSLSAGEGFTCGVAIDGAAYCWGDLPGTTQDAGVPTPVAGGRTFELVSAGYRHACGLSAQGTAYCWGDGLRGQLGDGSGTTSEVPLLVSGSLSFQSVSAGDEHTCAIDVTNAAHCWGENSDGELGDASGVERLTPTPVAGGLQFKAIAAGEEHTCGVTLGDEFYCWGLNREGMIGDGQPERYPTPNPVVGSVVLQKIGTGEEHACGTTSGGNVYCWGENRTGALGDGSLTDRAVPTVVSLPSIGAISASLPNGLNGAHSCAVTTAGAAYCWGLNENGQLGDGTMADRQSPTPVSGALTFRALSAGAGITCAVTTNDVAYCWGETSSVPATVTGGIAFQSVSAGNEVCGVSTTGLAYCWGATAWGSGASTQPTPIDAALVFQSISSGLGHSCGVTQAGAAYCWGENANGQLGDGSVTSSQTPVPVSGGLTFTEVSAGDFHTCGITSNGGGYCWGTNFAGQLGHGNIDEVVLAPTLVSGGLTFQTISAGSSYTCGVTTADQGYCWGGASDAIGDGLGSKRLAPARVTFP